MLPFFQCAKAQKALWIRYTCQGIKFTTFVNITFLDSIRTFTESTKTYFGCLLDYAIPNLIRK